MLTHAECNQNHADGRCDPKHAKHLLAEKPGRFRNIVHAYFLLEIIPGRELKNIKGTFCSILRTIFSRVKRLEYLFLKTTNFQLESKKEIERAWKRLYIQDYGYGFYFISFFTFLSKIFTVRSGTFTQTSRITYGDLMFWIFIFFYRYSKLSDYPFESGKKRIIFIGSAKIYTGTATYPHFKPSDWWKQTQSTEKTSRMIISYAYE